MPGTTPDRRDARVDLRSLEPCLITGATGEIGSYCVRLLNDHGARPMVLLRRPLPRAAWRDARVRELPGDLEQIAGGQLPPDLAHALRETRTLVHLAARVNLVGRGADEMRRINEKAALALFRAAQEADVRRFVHVSTTGAVGCAATPTPLGEDAEYNLQRFRNPYFDTKRRAEDRLREIWRAAPERTDLVIVNPSITIGRQGSFRRLARKRHRRPPPRPGSWLYKLICFWFSGGINLVDVRDAARGILLAGLHGRPGERYILCGDNLTIYELMDQLRTVFGTAGPRVRLPLCVVRGSGALSESLARLTGGRASWNRTLARLCGPYWFYDNSRAVQELGFRARPIEEILRDLRAWVDELGR